MSGPRFDRIVPLVTLVLVGLGVVFLLELNTELLVVNLGQGLPQISVAWALVWLLALVTGIGVELVARAQPQLHTSGWVTTVALGQRRLELALPLWSIPMLTPVAIFAFFRLFRGVLQTNAYLLVLVATFVLLLVVLSAQHYLIGGNERSRQVARTVLNIVAYLLAFAIFSVVTFNRYRTLYAIALVAPSALLLAADLLRGRVRASWTVAATIALLMIQSYWALSFWPTGYLLYSAALLVIFYAMIGLSQAASDDARRSVGAPVGLTRRAVLEYGLLVVVALLALALATVWLRARNVDLRGLRPVQEWAVEGARVLRLGRG